MKRVSRDENRLFILGRKRTFAIPDDMTSMKLWMSFKEKQNKNICMYIANLISPQQDAIHTS